MKHFKINVGREKLSSEYIQSKQNFNSVLTGVKLSKNKIWKTSWFYGVVGLAGVASIVGYNFYQSQEHLNETIITQNNLPEEDVKESAAILAVNNSNAQLGYSSAEAGYLELKMAEKQKEKQVPEIVALPFEEAPVSVPAQKLIDSPADVEKKAVSVKSVRNSMPSIAGVYNGDISWESFKEGIIFIGEDLAVKQFSIQYTTRMGDKTISVEGDKIPTEVVSELENLGLNQTIFITNVVGRNQGGELMRFVSMDLNLKFK